MTKRANVYEMYLNGLTIEQSVKQTGLSYIQVSRYYNDFRIDSIKLRGERNEDRLNQIATIENELFRLYKLAPSPLTYEKINKLEYTYVHFNALS